MIKHRQLLLLTIIFLSTIAYIDFHVQPVKAARWLAGYQYRKPIIVNGTSGAGMDYQLKFFVWRGTGLDEGFDVYLGGKCLPTYGDVRFTVSDGVTKCPYYIYSATSDYAVIWVKVLSDISVDQTLYIYYGNLTTETGSPESNLDETFVFAEPWDDSNLNTDRWINDGGGTISIDPVLHRVTVSGLTGFTLRSKNYISFPAAYIIEDFYADKGNIYGYSTHNYASATCYGTFAVHFGSWSSGYYGIMHVTRYHEYQSTSPAGYKVKILWGVGDADKSWTQSSVSTVTFNFRFEKSLSGTCNVYCSLGSTHTEANDYVPNRVIIYWAGSSNGLFVTGAFKIRKYVSPEPAIKEYGVEETLSGMEASITVEAEPSWIPNGMFKLDNETRVIPYSATIAAGQHSLTALDEQVTLNATHIYNFKCWKKNGAVYSYEPSCQFTIDVSETFEFTIVYEAYTIEVSTTPEGLTADFEADGWNLQTPTTIYRGPGYHTFQALTTIVYYNSTHLLKFMGWFVNDLFISPNENINLYIAKNSTVKLAYSFTETPQAPPMTFRAQLVSLGDLAPGSTKEFAITVLFDQNAITITKIEFQIKQEWFTLQEPLPKQASRGMETIGTATIQAQLKTPANIQGYYSIPFIVTATTPQDLTITTASYITFTTTSTPQISETTTLTAGGFIETITRLLGSPILLLLLIALIIWLASYSLKKH
jgi:hypothetical protein